ncbi:head-tail adaptor protein [Weissella kandleri]|uniref:phage head completion protein n=1 Tax=Weissella kandleri TaxID=1616 RepID=UPI00387E2D64
MSNKIDIYRYNKLLTFGKNKSTEGTDGVFRSVFSEMLSVWGALFKISDDGNVSISGKDIKVTKVFAVRELVNIDSTMIVKIDDHYYEIDKISDRVDRTDPYSYDLVYLIETDSIGD